MTDINDGGPAFPFSREWTDVSGNHNREECDGMTLRDYFAAKALMGMLASPELLQVVTSSQVAGGNVFERMALKSYDIADAMIKAREAK